MPKLRKDLCADALINSLRNQFCKIKDERKAPSIPLTDILMSGYAVFSLKYASLLAFDKECRMSKIERANLKSLFGISSVPSDTYMREVIDLINPNDFRIAFKELFSKVQRGKELEQFKYIDNKYLISMDGTGLFSSHDVHCSSCMIKESRKTGQKTYYHQMLGMVLLHPECKSVLPLCPEAILKQDGQSKNDSERNAAKRAIEKFRKDHPKLEAIILEDGLASNAPHLRLLKRHNLSYIITAKPGDHKYLFEQAHLAGSDRKFIEVHEGNLLHRFYYVNNLGLNEANEDFRVNFLEYEQYDEKKKKTIKFSWVTDLEITEENVMKIMRGGRARWKIENETFNTLKNQGYNFEHNYGHGNQNLCTNFAILMFLAFAIDQIQKLCCNVFQKALVRRRTFNAFCQSMLSCYRMIVIENWEFLLSVIAGDIKLVAQPPP
ncbi:MAG: transposase [Bdellovibrionota bacterium]